MVSHTTPEIYIMIKSSSTRHLSYLYYGWSDRQCLSVFISLRVIICKKYLFPKWSSRMAQKSVTGFCSFIKVIFNCLQMCCDLAESETVGSREHCWLWDTAEKGMRFFFIIIFNCFENLLTLEPLIRFRWDFQPNVPPLMKTPMKWKAENVTCSTFDWFP